MSNSSDKKEVKSATTTPEVNAVATPAPAPSAAKTVEKVEAKPADKAVEKTEAKPVAKPARAVAKPAAKKTAAKAAASTKVKTPAAKAEVSEAKKVKVKKVVEAKKPVDVEAKPKKAKLVRDSFTIPKDEFDVLAELKQRAQKLAHGAKKSEILRAGIRLLAGLHNDAFLKALKAVPAIKTGRPAAEKPVAAAKKTKA
jgi:hypothetical protein